MTKYLDENGLLYFWQKIKNRFSAIGHTHTIGSTTGDSVSVTAGTKASLTTTTFTVPNVTNAGSAATLGDPLSIPNVTSVGSAPTLGTAFTIPNISKKTVVTSVTKKTVVTGGTTTPIPNISVTSKSIPNVTNAGSAATATVSQGVLTITDGVAPTLGTAISVGSASAGTAIDAYTSLSTGDSVTVGTGDSVTVGTAFTVPNVTSVGSAPTLGTPISVPNVTSVGSAPTLGTAFTIKGVDVFTQNTPTAVTKKTVVTSVDATTGASAN